MSENRVIRVGTAQALGSESGVPGGTGGEERLKLNQVGVGTTGLLAGDHVLPRVITPAPDRTESVEVAMALSEPLAEGLHRCVAVADITVPLDRPTRFVPQSHATSVSELE